MKSAHAILLAVALVALTNFKTCNAEEFDDILGRLENCINTLSSDVLPFQCTENLIDNLKELPQKHKDLLVSSYDHMVGDYGDFAPVSALNRTINKIFAGYRKKATRNIELMEDIQSKDPIAFVLFIARKFDCGISVNLASSFREFYIASHSRETLRNSRYDSSLIEIFETNPYGELHSLSDEVLAEVTVERIYFTDSCIDLFAQIANEQYPSYNFYQQFEFVLGHNLRPHTSKHADDIQILYGGDVNDLGSVGHWVCVHYVAAERKLYVYDSMYRQFLSDNQLAIIGVLYPRRKGDIVFVPPAYIQTEYISCGLFAIFHATNLLMGQNPNEVGLTLNYCYGDTTLYMRLHILKMFANRQLAPFP